MKSLEAELQMTLLKRSHAGVCLTSDGEQLIPYIWELAMAEERMWEKAGEITGMDRGLIRSGYSAVLRVTICRGDERIPKIISGN